MKIIDKMAGIRKAITGAVISGLGAFAVAIQEVTRDGIVIDPAMSVSTAEWTSIIGTMIAALAAVYQVSNRKPTDPEEEAAEEEPESVPEPMGDVYVEPVTGNPAWVPKEPTQ